MADINLFNDKDVAFIKLQRKVTKDIDNFAESFVNLFESRNTDNIVILYFLLFWSHFHHIYGVNGELNDTSYVKKTINNIIDGDIPDKDVKLN